MHTVQEKDRSKAKGPTSPTFDTLQPTLQSDPLTAPVQLKPHGTTKTDVKTAPVQLDGGGSGSTPSLTPAADFKKSYAKDVVVQNLHTSRTDGSPKTVVAGWIGYLLKKTKPQAGDVTATYVSSFDTARGGFSASRTLPDVPDLVVHGHYQRDLSQPDTAKVNSAQVKWSDDEGGAAPPGETKLTKGKEPEILGADHDKKAIAAWNANPKRHEMRQDAVGKKRSKEKEQDLDLDWLFPG